jgi:hypothetical protein
MAKRAYELRHDRQKRWQSARQTLRPVDTVAQSLGLDSATSGQHTHRCPSVHQCYRSGCPTNLELCVDDPATVAQRGAVHQRD